MAQGKEAKAGIIGEGVAFTRESWAELKKVSTPTRQETVQATIVVVFMMVMIAAYLGLLDLIFNKLMQAVLS